MPARLESTTATSIQLTVELSLEGSLLEMEQTIQSGLNEAGRVASGEALKRFDSDGKALMRGGEKWVSKGAQAKRYQTPYGEVEVKRHVYQRSCGGKTYCPLDEAGRIVVKSTPKFAQQVAWKFSYGSAQEVVDDLSLNHARPVARATVQTVSEAVSAIAQAQEQSVSYRTPELASPIKAVSVSLDGTCVRVDADGYRETMVGTVSLYDDEGERQRSIYLGASPEYGKAPFLERLDRELEHVRQLYPNATYVGVADGASCNWRFLHSRTDRQILDFYHASEYLARASWAFHPNDEAQRQHWLEQHSHQLKHQQGAAGRILKKMTALPQQSLSATHREHLQEAIKYFHNHQHQMNYGYYRSQQLPIGSGVTEAACKTLVKQRLCRSGMVKWKRKGIQTVLSLRALILTKGRWQQFWDNIAQAGVQHRG